MRTKTACLMVLLSGMTTLGARDASAQSAGQSLVVEGGVAYAGHLVETTSDWSTLGGGVRWFVSPRLAIGPEITRMSGPGVDRSLSVTGNLTFDLRSRGSATRAVTPYIIVGGGWMHSRTEVGTMRTHNDGAATAGIGLRIAPSIRWFIAPEYRLSWHWRLGVQVGVRVN